MLAVWNAVWPILVAIFAFGFIIFIHEFGHFLFAKLFHIRVNEFSIGFGPKILKFGKGETKYSLGILPFGGYCAMEGEDGDSEDDAAFGKKKVWQRMIVVAAGAIFNLILGFVLMMTIVLLPGKLASTTVSKFAEDATSNVPGGLMEGDTLLKMDGRSIYTSDDISYMLGLNEDGKMDIVVRRDGQKVTLSDVQFPTQELDGRSFAVNDFYLKPVEKTFFGCIKEGFNRTVSMGRLIWMSLCDLVTGKYGLKDISGPVGITQVVSDAATTVTTNGLAGLVYLLRLLCMITVNLGIFNLLPIPALDGSRLVFLAIEGIRGKPVSPEKEGMVHRIGLLILLAFMVLIVIKDLWVWIF